MKAEVDEKRSQRSQMGFVMDVMVEMLPLDIDR
jgi:hypothetical protein